MKVGEQAMSQVKKSKTFIDLFSGVGGFRMGMEAAGHKCVGFVEIDNHARNSYSAIFDTEGEFEGHDITNITDDTVRSIGSVDIITGGFPCQAFSVAGKRRGFEDTRGTLFFEIMRWAKILKPETLFLENVPGLLNHNKGTTFETILRTMDEFGYDAEWDCLNACEFGVPQSRNRIFIIGHSREKSGRAIFPIQRYDEAANQRRIALIQEKKVPEVVQEDTSFFVKQKEEYRPILSPDKTKVRQNGRRYKKAGEPMFTLTAQDRHGIIVSGRLDIKARDQNKRVYDPKGISPTLTTMQGGGQEPKIQVHGNVNPSGHGMGGQVYNSSGISPTLTTGKGEGLKVALNDRGTEVSETVKIRRLTPKECWRLQGFPDWAYDKAAKINSNSQLYKQAGNSVAVPVILAIAEQL